MFDESLQDMGTCINSFAQCALTKLLECIESMLGAGDNRTTVLLGILDIGQSS